MLRITLAAAVASLLMVTGAFSQDGARAYFLLPENTNIISFTDTLLHGEAGGNAFDATIVTPSYRRSIDIGGNAGALLIGLPLGSLSASLGGGTVEMDTTLAQGDMFLGAELGLVGSPTLAPIDYAQYQPGLRVSTSAKLFLPTGEYDSSSFLNIGQNRWSLQANLPISYVLGSSVIDPELTTFEIVPFVHIFGNNDDPYGGPDVTGQAPIWGAEGHVSHSFTPQVWAALDAYFEAGGEKSADGVGLDDAQRSLALGATLGLTLNATVALRLSYTEQVYSSVPDTVARDLQLTTAFSF